MHGESGRKIAAIHGKIHFDKQRRIGYNKAILTAQRRKDMLNMKDPNCAYCMEGELLAQFGIKICELEAGILYLFKEQSHPGRVIVATKRHLNDIVDMTDEERTAFFGDVAHVSAALQKVFHPDKVNYGMYNDKGGHFHVHMVPKYKDQYEWGTVFEMNPGKTLLSDAEYDELIAKIKAAL